MQVHRSASRRRHRSFAARAAVAVLYASALVALAAGVAAANEFTGKIASVSGSKLVVDRVGDKVAFTRVESTVVSGAKSSWSDLAKGDWVSVTWKFEDKPPKAYRVRVLPAKGGN